MADAVRAVLEFGLGGMGSLATSLVLFFFFNISEHADGERRGSVSI